MGIYRIKYNGSDLWTPGTNDLINPVLEAELNTAGRLTFTMPPGHPSYFAINLLQGIIEVTENDYLLWSGRPVSLSRDIKNMKTVYVEGALAYLGDSIQRPRAEATLTPSAILTDIISVHNAQVPANRQFTIAKVEGFTSDVNWANSYETTLSSIKRLEDAVGGYIIPWRTYGTNYLDFVKTLPFDEGQMLEYGVNMTKFSREYTFENKFTAVLPVGGVPEGGTDPITIAPVNDNSDILEDNSEGGVPKYGRIVRLVKFDKITEPAELLLAAQQYMDAEKINPIRITCAAADLSFIDPEKTPFHIGYQYLAFSEVHELAAWLPLSKIRFSLDKAARDIELESKYDTSAVVLYKLSLTYKAGDVVLGSKDHRYPAGYEYSIALEAIEKTTGGLLIRYQPQHNPLTGTMPAADTALDVTYIAILRVVSIAITTPPTKVSYEVGELLDYTGMVVTATYHNGATAVVTNECTFDPEAGTAATQELTSIGVSYTDPNYGEAFTASQAVTIAYVTSIAITTPPNKVSYEAGELLDYTGMVVTATYNTGATVDVTSLCTFSPAAGSAAALGTTEVVASYVYGASTFTASQAVTVTAAADFKIVATGTLGYGLRGTEISIDWGDGTTSPAQSYNNTDATSTHTFPSSSAEYTVKFYGNITGITFSAFFGANIGLLRVLTPFPNSMAAVTSFSRCFFRCTRLTAIPAELFDHTPNVTDLNSCFYNCTSLAAIPAGLFDNTPNVTRFDYCFRGCTGLASIPAGLFDHTTVATYFDYCFSGCTGLTVIPAGLFDHVPNVTDFSNCFSNCTSLAAIPAGLFDNTPNVTSFSYCFSGCTSLTAIPAGLFDYTPNVTSFGNCFADCTSLTAIPSGSFDHTTAVTNFYCCFYNCTSLAAIPAGLFDYTPNVTSFGSCFYNCTSLTAIPSRLFDNTPNVTNFSSCFSNCTRLTAIPAGLFDHTQNITNFGSCFADCTSLTAIPAGLFDHTPKVTNFERCFYNCTSLAAIPAGLFDYTPNVTSFYYCFFKCRALTSIPAGLFDLTTAVTRFDYCFRYCTGLTAIPAGLFDHTTAVTSFSYCFSECTGLTVIPAGLFDHTTNVTSFNSCFYNCTAITSAVPELWDTTKWPAVTSKTQCFYKCTSAANYADIPSGWK